MTECINNKLDELRLQANVWIFCDQNDFFEMERVGSHEGVYGDSSWELQESRPYQLAAVQVLKYFTTFSVDVLLSKPFQLINPASELADNELSKDN